MTCPTCNAQLYEYEVQTDSSGKFMVDHCGGCGGTWFDPYELNRIPFHEVVKLARLSVWRTNASSRPNHPMHCPKDSHLLEPFHSDSVPSGIHFLRCKFCFGLWAGQKDLEEFKKTQDDEDSTNDEKKQEQSTAFPSLKKIAVPVGLILLLFFSTFITILHLQSQKDSRAQAQSLISNLSVISAIPSGIVVSFETLAGVRSQITYGESILMADTKWISVAPTRAHSIILSDLKPNSTYTYTITLEDEIGANYTTTSKSFSSGE